MIANPPLFTNWKRKHWYVPWWERQRQRWLRERERERGGGIDCYERERLRWFAVSGKLWDGTVERLLSLQKSYIELWQRRGRESELRHHVPLSTPLQILHLDCSSIEVCFRALTSVVCSWQLLHSVFQRSFWKCSLCGDHPQEEEVKIVAIVPRKI